MLKNRLNLNHQNVLSIVSESHHGFCSKTFAVIWNTMHMISLDYPVIPTQEERQLYTTQFLTLLKCIPCSACRKNVSFALKAIQFNEIIDMSSRKAYAYLVWRLHDYVDMTLGKTNRMSFEEMNVFYEKLRASDCSSDSCTRKDCPQCVITYVPVGSVSADKIMSFAE